MMWTIIEIIAIVAESFLALAFNIGYFKLMDNKYYYLKILGGTITLSLWDYFGTMLVKTEFLAMSGFAAILFLFSLLYLKKSAFEKFIVAIISCTLFYLILKQGRQSGQAKWAGKVAGKVGRQMPVLFLFFSLLQCNLESDSI